MTTASTIGLISPGKMGASVGAAAVSRGHTVIWAGGGRSDSSHNRATEAGLQDCGSLQALYSTSDILLSVCPPHDAESVAEAVVSAGFDGLFVDCNAISPAKTRSIAAGFKDGQFVDGGIIGGPAWHRDAGTCLYLSGTEASRVETIFQESPLHVRVVSDEIGAASALKMVFAAYTKGSTALLTAILAVAEKEGVRADLERQWGEQFTNRTHGQLAGSSEKAWRFAGEMREIAETFEAAGMPGGFHNSAAEVFEQLATFKDNPATTIDEMLSVLLK